jgi:hypothetical protein
MTIGFQAVAQTLPNAASHASTHASAAMPCARPSKRAPNATANAATAPRRQAPSGSDHAAPPVAR